MEKEVVFQYLEIQRLVFQILPIIAQLKDPKKPT